MEEQIIKNMNILSQRMLALEKRINQLYMSLHEDNAANIDYIAMMTEVDIPSKEDDEEEEE